MNNVMPPTADRQVYRVLVVDDDDGIRRMLCRFLAVDGFATIEAENGQAALERLREAAPVDVILLDLRMPVMNGWTFRQEQRRDQALAHIPVVVLSGAGEDRFDEIDASATFHKPARPSEVVQRLRQICDSSRSGG